MRNLMCGRPNVSSIRGYILVKHFFMLSSSFHLNRYTFWCGQLARDDQARARPIEIPHRPDERDGSVVWREEGRRCKVSDQLYIDTCQSYLI